VHEKVPSQFPYLNGNYLYHDNRPLLRVEPQLSTLHANNANHYTLEATGDSQHYISIEVF